MLPTFLACLIRVPFLFHYGVDMRRLFNQLSLLRVRKWYLYPCTIYIQAISISVRCHLHNFEKSHYSPEIKKRVLDHGLKPFILMIAGTQLGIRGILHEELLLRDREMASHAIVREHGILRTSIRDSPVFAWSRYS